MDGDILLFARDGGAGGTFADKGVVHRAAKLFQAGSYPDKGVTVTEADLDGLIGRFQAAAHPAPVKVEHIDSPLDPLGEVVGLYRRGGELFGLLAFPAEVDALLRARGVEKLSVGLVREPAGLTLSEVSLTARPRVPDAAFLSTKIGELSAAGKLTPATAPIAARLLSVSSPVTFGADSGAIDVAAEFAAFLAAMPPVQPRAAQVPPTAFHRPDGEQAVPPAAARLASGLGIAVDRLMTRLRHSAGEGAATDV